MRGTGPVGKRWAELWQVLAVVALLAAGWFVYRPALTGTFLLDDLPTLGDLRSVDDMNSAVQFVLSGFAGPMGRPIALASFLPQASAIGLNAEPFIRVNILIHLLNGLLVFAFARKLGSIATGDQRNVPAIALGVTAIWLFMPLLASSSLLIVQRMTTLSATFVLAGLNAYLIARGRLETRPNATLLFMSLALVLATVLATLTKENGALLPVFVLVLEATILSPPQSLSKLRWSVWRGLFLAVPTLSIIVYLLLKIPYSGDIVAIREFTASERLFSEARILWEYLFNAFFAVGGRLGPFHESRPVNGLLTEPWTVVAVAAWVLILATAIRVRRQYPAAAFAVLWFLAGHLLESTTIPLELYFEHRNYLPIIGPVFVLCLFLFQIEGRYRLVWRVAVALYAVLNAAILFGIASMWGKPLLAATYWYEQDSDSVRAATTLASQQLSMMGPDTAVTTLREFTGRHPEHAYVRIPELNLACVVRPDDNHAALVDYLKSALTSVAHMPRTGEMLDQLLSTVVASRCDSVSPETVADLAAAVMRNPRYSQDTRYNQFHAMLMARIARESGHVDQTLEHLYQAIEFKPSDDLNMMIVTTLVAAERFEEAREFIDGATDDLPYMPLKRYNSKRTLEELLSYVDAAARVADNPSDSDIGD
jgi:hypothetical protein